MVRSCDTVSAGAFFPQAPLEPPQKEMRQHRREHMVVPPRVFAHFIVVHPEVGFPFLKTLLDGPPQPTEPHKGAQGCARWGITDLVAVVRIGTLLPLDHEPDAALRQAVLTPRHPLASKGIQEWPFGPFRDVASIPRGGRQPCG